MACLVRLFVDLIHQVNKTKENGFQHLSKNHTEYFATFISTKPEDDDKCVEIRNPCSNGLRSGLRTTAITIRQLSYCRYRVKNAQAIQNFKECCLHPYVYRFVPGVRNACKNIIG